jgi:glycosyltransferase involved in cell wall biosynthesis
MKTVSIVIPCIRAKNLEKIYDALQKACSRYPFELIITSPYKIPDSILAKDNVVYIHSYQHPTAAVQAAIQMCNAEFLYLTADDGLVQAGAIDTAIDMFRNNKMGDTDIVNMKYHEDALEVDTLEVKKELTDFPADYWSPWRHQSLQIAGINPNWVMALQFFVKLNYFYQLGGFDCGFEILNYSLHDFVYRAQQNGSKVQTLPQDAFLCSWLSHHNGDHGPVHDAAVGPDKDKFYSIYTKANAAQERIRLYYQNWRSYDSIWTRRFDKNNLPL